MNYWRYTGIFLGLSIGLPILLELFNTLTGVNLSSAAVAIIPAFVAAMIEGQSFARRNTRLPDKSETRAFARKATLIALAITVVVSGVTLATQYTGDPILSDPIFFVIVGVISLFFAIITYFANGWFLRTGARNEVKRLDRLKSK